MRFWIFITSPENYDVCLMYNVFGVDERYQYTALNHIDTGDIVFFYITEKKKFTGPFKVLEKGKYDPNHVAVSLWKSRKNKRYEYIIKFEPLRDKFGECNLEEVFDKLVFITNRKEYSDHFQFSIVSICREDYNTILKCIDKQIR